MPSPPACAPAPPLPRRSAVATDAQRQRALERLDRRVARVRHRGVHAAHPVGPRPPALPTADGLVVHPSVAAEEHVVHRALARGADPLGHDLRERAEAHVGDALAHLDVPRTDRDRRRPRPPPCRAARSRAPAASRRRSPGSSGRSPRAARTRPRSRSPPRPRSRCPAAAASVPVKSNVARVAVDRQRQHDARRRLLRGRGPGRVEHVLERATRRRAARRAPRACAARRSRRSRRAAPSDPSASTMRAHALARRSGSRRAARRGRRAARPACASCATRIAATPSSRRTGGMRRPSSSISVASGGIEPGAIPPTSAWCARFATHPTSASRDEARRRRA